MSQPSEAAATRELILDACLGVIERRGMAEVTLDEVARTAGRSRATVYRHFPGGREELLSATVTRETGRFLARMTAAMASEDPADLEGRLVAGLAAGHRALADHRLLHRLLASEPEALFNELLAAGPLLSEVLRYEMDATLEAAGTAEEDRERSADYLARMMLSHLGSPAGWDLTDPESVRRLVRIRFVAGLRS